ncbi:DUF3806 domain-containing protein [Jonesiaceae bacterium BS-20]|uniref:DUF3806 domain-containing protein n=1 Tax=Jonesiaceae bacterium BS-20 TaxID=3120821 RepID=A0AAU7DWV4_9MICO
MHATSAHQPPGLAAGADGVALRARPKPHTPAPPQQATTRAQLHRELRESAAAIPVPLRPESVPSTAGMPAVSSDIGTRLQAVQATGKQLLQEPTIPELMWLEEMRLHLHHPADPAPDGAALSSRFDEFCTAWHQYARRNRWDPTYAVTSLGIGLGDLLVSLLPHGRWMVSKTQESTVFAVRDDSKRVTFLPLDAVARRWDGQQLRWIEAFIDQAVNTDITGQIWSPPPVQ